MSISATHIAIFWDIYKPSISKVHRQPSVERFYKSCGSFRLVFQLHSGELLSYSHTTMRSSRFLWCSLWSHQPNHRVRVSDICYCLSRGLLENGGQMSYLLEIKVLLRLLFFVLFLGSFNICSLMLSILTSLSSVILGNPLLFFY